MNDRGLPMEFNEKLQKLRKKNGLTQEQLAGQLYVSRTAISKWESGKGYPNIESLKCLSKFFSVSIDELLSNDELITLAECENRSNLKKIYSLISSMIDVLAVAFIVLPIYGKPEGGYVYSVNLLANTMTPNINIFIHWAVFLCMIGIGILRLTLIHFDRETIYNIASKFSLALGAIAICLFAAAREPYATILLFLFFAAKTFIQWKQIQINS